jgi:hypothetical protein
MPTTVLAQAAPPTPPEGWLSDAHARLLADPRYQFSESTAPVTAPFRPSMGWIDGAAHILSPVLLGVLICALIVGGMWWRRRGRRSRPADAGPSAPARARTAVLHAYVFLNQADAFARQRDYRHAAHMLLLGGLHEVMQRCPGVVRPGWTSLDIAHSPALPARARANIARAAMVIEHGLFGGGPVSADDYAGCHAAIRDLIDDRSWPA